MQVGQIKVKWFYKDDSTVCVVQKDKDTLIAKSEIKRYVKDRPCKKYARAKSFRKVMVKIAIKEMLPKPQRELIWNTFRETITQPTVSVS